MRTTLHTLQGMTIGGNRIKKLMDTDRYHQGERIKSKESASARPQPRNLQSRGRVPNPQTTQDLEYEELKIIKIMKMTTKTKMDSKMKEKTMVKMTMKMNMNLKMKEIKVTNTKMKAKTNLEMKENLNTATPTTKKLIDTINRLKKETIPAAKNIRTMMKMTTTRMIKKGMNPTTKTIKRVIKKKMIKKETIPSIKTTMMKMNTTTPIMVIKTAPQALEKSTMKLLLSKEKIMSRTPHGLYK